MLKPDSFQTFLLDECLPYRIAEILWEVGCPVTSVERENLGSTPDQELIRWMGKRAVTWITKDGVARSQHSRAIEKAGISVVWVRGMERDKGRTTKNTISKRDLLHMLVARIDVIASDISKTKGPRYFLLYLSGNRPKLTQSGSLQTLGKHKRRN